MPDYLLAAHIQVTGGSEAAAQLQIVQTQINNFSTAAKNAGTGQMAGDFEKAAQSGSTFSNVMDRVGSALIRMATYQGISLIEGALRSAVGGILDFDSAMTNSLSIQRGVTEDMRADMEHLAETLAVKFGEAPAEVAKGFYYLASAGLTVNQQMADLPVVLEFARAGMMSVDKATDMLFDSLTALGLKADDPAQQLANLTMLSDKLTEAAIKSMGTVEDFGAALQNKAGGMAKAFGIDLNETIGMLEVFADRGIKGAKAGDAFNQLIRDMGLKATEHADAFKNLGIAVYDSSGNMNSLVTIMSQVDKAFGGMGDAERIEALHSLGFTQRNITLIQSLIGTSGQLAIYTADLKNAGGVTEEVANKQMESLRAKLDQLKSMAIVFSIQGFEKLEEAAAWLVSTFSPAVQAVMDVLGQIGGALAPFAADLGHMTASAVPAVLQGVADAIGMVFSTIAAHPGVVEGLAYALATLGAGSVIGNILAAGVAIYDAVAVKAAAGMEAVNRLIISLMTMDKATAFEGLKGAWSSLVSALNTPIVAGAMIALMVGGIIKQYHDGKDAADKFANAINAHVDLNTLGGIDEKLRELQGHYDALNDRQNEIADKGFWQKLGTVAASELDAITPGFFKFSDNLITLKGELAGTSDQIKALTQYKDNVTAGFGEIGNAINGTGTYAKNFLGPVSDMQNGMRGIGQVAQEAGVKVDASAPALSRLAAAAKIDLSADWHKWAPILEEAAVKSALLGDNTGRLDGAVVALSDDMAPFEDQLKAFKDTLEGVAGSMDKEWDGTTKLAGAFGTLGEALGASVPTFDASTEAGRKQRDALSGVASAARDMAEAHAAASGSLQAGVGYLEGYGASLANLMSSAGVAKDQINALLAQMGLAPDQIQTVWAVVQDPKNATGDIKAGMDDAGDSAAITAGRIDLVKGALDRLKGPISDLQAQNQLAEGLLNLGEAAAKYVQNSGPLNDAWTTNSKEADALKDSLYSTAQGQIAYAQSLADQPGRLEEGIQGLRNYKQSVTDMMGALGMSQPQIDAVLSKLGLTDAAIDAIKPGVDVPVSEHGAAETGAKLDNTANPGGKPRVADVQAQPTNTGPTSSELYNIANPGAQARVAWMWSQPNGASVTGATNALDFVAMPGGAARAAAYQAHLASGDFNAVNADLNWLARARTAYIRVDMQYNLIASQSVGPHGEVNVANAAQGAIFPSVHAYASGGFENHIAQFAKAGAWRVWAEPETGGEAYIPLAPSKKAQSTAIWEETGRRLGVQQAAPSVNIHSPTHVTINGSGLSAADLQAAVASGVNSANEKFARALLVELQTR